MKYFTLALRDLRLSLPIGCTAAERQKPQAVSVDLTLRLTSPPQQALQDQSDSRLCYARMRDLVLEVTEQEKKEFQLIEALAHSIFQVIKAYIGEQALLCVDVHKLNAPLSHLLGGSHFQISEFMPHQGPTAS